jgi:uncharacterized protein DUF3551
MRALILSSGLLAAALIGGPQAALAQNEFTVCRQDATGSLTCEYNSLEQCRRDAYAAGDRCVLNPATTGQSTATPLPPPGGGEYLPPPSR